jgi:hypothetical protein
VPESPRKLDAIEALLRCARDQFAVHDERRCSIAALGVDAEERPYGG